MRPLIEFYWQVPEVGFEWVTTKQHVLGVTEEPETLPYLVARIPFAKTSTARNYPAFTETGLFRRFTAVEPTQDGVLEFANQYGLLGGELTKPVSLPTGEEPKTSYSAPGESLGQWAPEIYEMRHAVELWENARAGDTDKLLKRIRWQGSSAKGEDDCPYTRVTYRGPFASWVGQKRFIIASERKNRRAFDRFQDGDVVLPAWYALQRLVNEKLRQHNAVPKMLWDFERREPELSLAFVPESLIAALWLQFSHAITGNKEYRQCEQCGRWFELAAEVRADGKFCQGACRSRAYRARKAEARKLHAEGASIGKIAKQLNSDSNTVKGWVK